MQREGAGAAAGRRGDGAVEAVAPLVWPMKRRRGAAADDLLAGRLDLGVGHAEEDDLGVGASVAEVAAADERRRRRRRAGGPGRRPCPRDRGRPA